MAAKKVLGFFVWEIGVNGIAVVVRDKNQLEDLIVDADAEEADWRYFDLGKKEIVGPEVSPAVRKVPRKVVGTF